MANTDYGSMNASALKVELRKRSARLNCLKEQLIQRLQDYDRNNIFVGNITNGIKNDDLAYTVEWPSDSSYISVTSKSCGFFISTKYPHTGASPEGLIGDLTALEVKCPFSIKDEFISADNYKHIEVIIDEFCLKENSPYYFQIQTQLLVTERSYCDFIYLDK